MTLLLLSLKAQRKKHVPPEPECTDTGTRRGISNEALILIIKPYHLFFALISRTNQSLSEMKGRIEFGSQKRFT